MVKRKTTRTARDWEEAALDAIAAGGLRSLAIPELARTLGVTKGSFYWHFEKLDALVWAALRRWEEDDRQSLVEASRITDPRARLVSIFTDALRHERAHALCLTLAASDDSAVRTLLRRISERRVRFLTACYEELGVPTARANARALLAYSAYLGLLQLRRHSSSRVRSAKDLDAFAAHAVETLIPASS